MGERSSMASSADKMMMLRLTQRRNDSELCEEKRETPLREELASREAKV